MRLLRLFRYVPILSRFIPYLLPVDFSQVVESEGDSSPPLFI